jgi:hypothetical protein
VWRSECLNTPGFAISVGASESISFSDFKNATNVIYRKVSIISQKCIDSEEYMQVYIACSRSCRYETRSLC